MMAELWAPLTDSQRRFLTENIATRRFKRNEVIYQAGQTPVNLMCLLKGKVKVYKDGIGGRQQIVRTIKPVGFFGYRASFANENYSTSSAAFEPSLVCLIPVSVIKQIVKENNQVAVFFIQQLANLLGHADERTVNLTQKHIRGRLAESLVMLKDKYGVEEDGSTLSIYLSREDLANMSNMTTSNAIRTLSSFATENLIAIDGRKIKIIEDERLRKVSKIG